MSVENYVDTISGIEVNRLHCRIGIGTIADGRTNEPVVALLVKRGEEVIGIMPFWDLLEAYKFAEYLMTITRQVAEQGTAN